MALVLSSDYPSTSTSTNTDSDKVYVAVSKESTVSVLWAIQRFTHSKLCILHVHHPSPPNLSQEQRDMEEAIMSSKLDEYILICTQSGIEVEKLYLEANSFEKGILELISQHKIQKLIMGAAADQNYDMKMLEPKSSKAIYVMTHAPPFCHIWFICKGNLVCTREAKFDSLSSVDTQEITVSPQTTMNFEAVCRANALENLYTEELRKRKEIEAESQMLKNHHDKTLEEAADQKLVITNCEQTIKQLEEKVAAYAELVKLREEERDEAVKLSRDLAETVLELSSETNPPEFFLTLPSSEILEAASESDLAETVLDLSSETNPPEFFLTLPSSEILEAASESDQSTMLLYEGELGNIYKAVLYHTDVTIRFLPEEELLLFQHEVKVLSKFRHPNLATLIGASPETPALVYEHLPNGTLEDRLRCKGDTRPLSWQTRIKIAVELCCALIFLHSHGVTHCALRPSCVLLDSNFSCKIIDFRSSYMGENPSTTTSVYVGEYTDPEFLDAVEPYPKMDLYSFGLMLLELLTGRPGFSVVEEVRSGLDLGTLDSLLDTSAGEWSFLLAEQLAHLGLSCCTAEVSARPCLKSDVWKVLEPMRLSTGSALSFRAGEAPSYFVCPILQEVMEDPHVASDGFTYEAEALRQWLDRGNGTSPLTNLELDDTSLVPNRALRSAIQEWQQLQRQ